MTQARDAGREVAIIGMACVFPGAGSLEAFWRNVSRGVDAITEVPPDRWDPEFFDPDSDAIDRLYCKRGGFIDEFATFDALRWGVMPVAAQASEPDQLLALEVAARALDDAGYAEREFSRDSTGVILGRGGYLAAGQARWTTKIRTSEELVLALRALVPEISEETLGRVRREFQSKLGRHGPDTVIGLVPNLAASRVANRLDLRGPAYTIDAACASSLIAVDRACSDLLTGRADLVLAGGVHVCHDVSFWSVFCQMGALSRRQQIRPFDRRADGILIGEGVGVVVLKRLADARRDGDRVYAVIRGTGVSSDGRVASVLTPAIEGQQLALRRAWKMAGLDPTAPDSAGLIEAHGTATHAGDQAELTTLRSFFGDVGAEGAIGLGSIKSMIGHTMPAAGAAGLIKAVLAVHRGTLPPTLHCEEPHEALEGSRFRPILEAEPWEANGAPRRAGINAFGFGGINAHVLIEEDREAPRPSVSMSAARERVLLRAAESPEKLVQSVRDGGKGPGNGPCRLAVIDPTADRVAKAIRAAERGRPFHGRQGIWFTPRGMLGDGGKVAFLFPGVDAEFKPRVEDVARTFGREVPYAVDILSRATSLERTGFGIVMVNRLLHDVLGELGVSPDFVCGHSIGEWSAMIAARVIADADIADFARGLEPGSLSVPGVVFAAAGCGLERARKAIGEIEDVVVSHDNCPHQVILCGLEERVEPVLARLRSEAVLCQKLDFRSGFHTPLFREHLGQVRKDLARLELHAPRIPLWSATTCKPYPTDPAAIRELFLDHLVHPVRFHDLLRTLHDEGARVFVQVGTGSLVGFVSDSLKDRPHLAIGANSPKREGLEQLRRTVAALWVEGADVHHARLFALHDPGTAVDRSIRLELGAPLVRLEKSLALPAKADLSAVAAGVTEGGGGDPVLAEFASTLAALERSGRDVLEAWKTPRSAGGAPRRNSVTVTRRLDFESDPHLLDHCFFPQPEGWPHPADRFPVVPMTMSLEMMMSAARRVAGDRIVVGLEKVRARRWLAVEGPTEVRIHARRESDEVVSVEIGEKIACKVRLGSSYPPAPPADRSPCRDERPLPMAPHKVYEDRWMFHGPSYHGIVELTGLGEREIRGVIESLPAEGALLDAAGQIAGLWISVTRDRDRLAMPAFVESITFHGPAPPPGRRCDCRAWIEQVGRRRVRVNIDVAEGDRVWCRILGWEDHRFETNEPLWAMITHPERNVLAAPHPGIPGCHVMREDFSRTATRDYFARRYLDGGEVAAYRSMNPRRQIDWLAGRVAVKDAVRAWLWRHGAGPLFPIEVEVSVEASGRPRVRCARGDDLRVSVSGKHGMAVAIVAEGRDVGIDLERIEARDASFEETAFAAEERAMLPDRDREAWVTRFWSGKEAVAKSRGTGLEGNPRRFEVRERDGERLLVDGQWVGTLVENGMVYAWTIEEP